jgi:DNA-binding XRE family transcriptional regulator
MRPWEWRSYEPCRTRKQKRIELGLTQEQAAEKAGIRQQSWASIEDGKTKSLATL